MEPLQTLAFHHQQWNSHTDEDSDSSYLQPVPKLPRLLAPRDASRVSGMASSVGLGLGLGWESGQSAFTYSQLQELEHQALILKYMVAGVPVPLHLVLPIWKSVVSSPVGGRAFQPSSLSGGGLCFDFRSSMEPEPGRCRRTDGKKWRCSKEVVPDHKYCEKHMHRGKSRSRKPVERQPLSEPSKPINSAATSNNNNTEINTNISDSSTHLSISIAEGIDLMNNLNTSGNNTASLSSSPMMEFSPTSVLPKVYYGCSISDSSSGSTSKTESNLS